MTRYLDTSLLVAALTREAATERMQQWLGEQNPEDLAISHWVMTEFSSALSIKVRTGALSSQDRAAAMAVFTEWAAVSFSVHPVTANHFRTAARYADNYALGVRAGDALHLAIAGLEGSTLCTLDRRLAEGGRALGVDTLLL